LLVDTARISGDGAAARATAQLAHTVSTANDRGSDLSGPSFPLSVKSARQDERRQPVYPVARCDRAGAGPGRGYRVGRQPRVGEDGAHDSWVLDGGDDPRPAAASGTGHDIESEHAGINAAQVQACGRPGGRGRTNPPV